MREGGRDVEQRSCPGIGTSRAAVESRYCVGMAVPLASVNLRCNPFGELTLAERRSLAVGDFADLAAELLVPGTAIQVRGDCGRGKSSHLHGLAAHLPQARYSRVDHGGPVCAGGIYLMDEADHFGPLRRWWYLRLAESVAVATHADMTPFLRRCGYRVVDVPVGQVSAAHLRQIVGSRLEWARLSSGVLPEVSDEHLQHLLAEFGDDIRAVEGALYDWIVAGAPLFVETG